MTKVNIFENGFVVKGHADYAEYGKDIVCSAISATTQTALQGLILYCDAIYDMYEGNLSVHVARPSYASQIILKTMVLGLKEIEKEYPNHIKVKEELA
jgi:uncharacterized protein YsxB (DUF464 family)